MNDSRWVIIANPVSGRGRAHKTASRFAEKLAAEGAKVTLEYTQSGTHAESLAREAAADRVDRLVACGGDGTVHQVINGMLAGCGAGPAPALGLLPAGRCNDLASYLGIPRNSAGAEMAVLGNSTRTIDLGRIGDRYFATVATLGFDTEVSRYVAEGRPPFFLKGTLAYLYSTLVKLARYKDVEMHLKGDFGEYSGPVFLAATGNTPNYGGRMKIAPSAVADDGCLDLCLVRPAPKWEVLRMMPRVFSGTHVNHPSVSMQSVRRMEISAPVPLWLWADGEPVTQTPATIEVVPGALSVLVPEKSVDSRPPR